MRRRRYGAGVTNLRERGDEPYIIPLSLDGRAVLSFEPRQSSGWAAYFSDEVEKSRTTVYLRVGLPVESVREYRDSDFPLQVCEFRVMGSGAAPEYSTLTRSIPWDRIEAAINQPSHRMVLAGFIESADIRGFLPSDVGPWVFKTTRCAELPPLQLEVPEGYRKPDEFYRKVGELFLALATVSSRPAQELAEANGVKPTTVHRWIREAKARGVLLLPSDKGGT
jgi:hypothetical protein